MKFGSSRTISGAIIIAVVGGSIAFASPQAAAADTPANLTVDAGTSLGSVAHLEKYDNIGDDVLASSDISLFGQVGGFKIFRAWPEANQFYNWSTNTPNYSYYYPYLDQIAPLTDRIILDFSDDTIDPQVVSGAISASKYQSVLEGALVDYKTRYPNIEYIEALNEPTYTDDQYYAFYKIFYQAINDVNATLTPAVTLKVGGPVNCCSTNVNNFLDRYAADTSSAKRLDFIDYHHYDDNPRNVMNERATVSSQLSSHGLSTSIPVFVTETGSDSSGWYPSSNGMEYILKNAALLASMQYFYENQSNIFPFMFVTRKEPTLSQLNSTGVPSANYNLIKMKSMMKTTRISATSDTQNTTDGTGLYGLASKDSTGVAVMAWNYQANKTINSASPPTYATNVGVSNLPTSFSGQNVHVERYLIDSTHSNDYYNASTGALQKVEDYVTTASGSFAKTISLAPNALSLLVLTPVAPSGSGGTVVDQLNDWSHTSAHSSNWYLDSNLPAYFNGDTSRAARTSDTAETITYNYANVTAFSAAVYTYGSTLASKVSIATSADNATYTSQTVTLGSPTYTDGGWYSWNVSASIPSGTSYVKLGFANDSLAWTPQLSSVTVVYAGASSGPSGATTTDQLADWSQLGAAGSHTAGWTFDSSYPTYFEGDTSRATRTTDTAQSIVYNYTGITNVAAKIYYYQNIAGRVSMFTSPDGSSWTALAVTNDSPAFISTDWYRTVFSPSGAIPSGTNYLKIQFANDSLIWTPQLSQVVINH